MYITRSNSQVAFVGNVVGTNAAGPTLLNEAATSTNPTLVPNRADPDTGMGWVSANVGALVAGGSSAAQWGSSSFSVAGALVSNVATAISGADRPLATDDTANLVVYSTTTPATDVGGSIGLGHSSHGGALLAVIKGMKASSGTNIGELAFALRSDAAFATEMARLTSTQFGMSNAAGPALLNEAATSTNPTLVANRADPDTGVGWNSTNHGSLIAGGTEVASFAAAAFNITGAANVKQANNGVSGGLVLTRSDSAVYSSVYTGGDDKTYLQNNNGRYIALSATTGNTGGAGSAGSGNQYVELNINGSRYKLLHDGTI
jgi:hypothetical protein